MKHKSLVILIGFLAIAYGLMTGCGSKLKPNENNASSGYGNMPSTDGSSTLVSVDSNSQGFGEKYWHGCKYAQSGVIVSCFEMENITSPSSCQSGVYVDSCPTINLVAKCRIWDTYITLIKINYEYSGTLEDAQQYTILQSGVTMSCSPG